MSGKIYMHPKFKGANDNLSCEKFDASEENYMNYLTADGITENNLLKMERERMERQEMSQSEREMHESREAAQEKLRNFWRKRLEAQAQERERERERKRKSQSIWQRIKDFFKGE